ncbi:hypothetical protein F2P81_004090 [Scophthalmus maximus]|uniref:Uncharacterized protein n=1 Tax=Scophthalmus maximus TaxID=52904 RepID=A0A6A4T9J7_SCOMX|nr:hypothetical protein F2P81_004090 [Scophthalmus maximus]
MRFLCPGSIAAVVCPSCEDKRTVNLTALSPVVSVDHQSSNEETMKPRPDLICCERTRWDTPDRATACRTRMWIPDGPGAQRESPNTNTPNTPPLFNGFCP